MLRNKNTEIISLKRQIKSQSAKLNSLNLVKRLTIEYLKVPEKKILSREEKDHVALERAFLSFVNLSPATDVST